MNDFPQIIPKIDSAELNLIKTKLALRDRINSDQFGPERDTTLPTFFDLSSRPSDLTQSTLRGLKFPLELDGEGSLKLSSGYDRIGEQILEILETRLGERVYRPFFGIPEVIFESIDEYALAQTIRSQLLAFIPAVPDINVRVLLGEDGTARLFVYYSVEGTETALIQYSFSL